LVCKFFETLKAKTFRVTPAMVAGVTEHLWTIEEIIGLMNEARPNRDGRTRIKDGPRDDVMYYLRKIVIGVATLFFGLAGLIGFVFGLGAIGMLVQCAVAIFTGVFVRDDLLEATGEVRIVRATDPDWFWGNIEFYAFVSLLLGLFAWGLVSLAIGWIKHQISK
jgi:hypothetical protein